MIVQAIQTPVLKPLVLHVCTCDHRFMPSIAQGLIRTNYRSKGFKVYAYKTLPEVQGLFGKPLDPSQEHAIIFDEASPTIALPHSGPEGQDLMSFIYKAVESNAAFVIALTKKQVTADSRVMEPVTRDGLMTEAVRQGSGCLFCSIRTDKFLPPSPRSGETVYVDQPRYVWPRLLLKATRFIQFSRVKRRFEKTVPGVKLTEA